jgi:hypothetical protein
MQLKPFCQPAQVTPFGLSISHKGCLLWMGQVIKQDLVISIQVMLAYLAELERDWQMADSHKQQTLAFIGAFACIAYGSSFRGNEVFLVDLWGLLKYAQVPLEENSVRYVIVPLLGRFKSKEGERYHLTPLAYVTDSGIRIGIWLERLIKVKRWHGQSWTRLQ